MLRILSRFFFVISAIVTMGALSWGGCGGKGPVTEPLLVAKISQSDVPDNMLSLLTALQALSPAAAAALTSDAPRLIDVSSGPACSEAPSPIVNTPPTYVTRILPFHISGGVSGSCGLTADTSTSGNMTTISMLLFCEDLVVQEILEDGTTKNATYNGQIGFAGTVTDDGNGQKTLDFVNSSKGLTVTLGSDDPCDV